MPPIEGYLKAVGLESDTRGEPLAGPDRHSSMLLLTSPTTSTVAVSDDCLWMHVKSRVDVDTTGNTRLAPPRNLPCVVVVQVDGKATCRWSVSLNVDLLSG